MPKLLFSKIHLYDLKDLLMNVQKPRRIDIVLSGRRHKNYTWNISGQKVTNETSDLSWPDDRKHQLSLEKILANKKYLAAFRSYLQSEFSEENIEFWLACEDFKTTALPEDLHWKAEKIYEEFIKPTANREINVDHHVREKIQRSLEKPSCSCFDEAQKHVYLLMLRDTCPRFLHSDAYLSLKRKSRTMWYI
ncbi:regulator of G-protein signaling 21 [Nothobranchius furzeri]|uniref:Regulator of G protein signaling 1 n=1 Tax=Nothobranchius furzeri TaxID=105023 RepID=A0A8C6LKK7_NOTFU|nr:regulator of G-protein signaling 21-like [Nothobranchius furzeri]